MARPFPFWHSDIALAGLASVRAGLVLMQSERDYIELSLCDGSIYRKERPGGCRTLPLRLNHWRSDMLMCDGQRRSACLASMIPAWIILQRAGRPCGFWLDGPPLSGPGSWCGRGDLNPHGHTADGFSYPLRLSPPPRLQGAFGVWTIPSPYSAWAEGRCCPSSLYTFPLPGLARDCHVTGFPEFEQFYVAGFPARTQLWLSPLRLPIPPRPQAAFAYSPWRNRRQGRCAAYLCQAGQHGARQHRGPLPSPPASCAGGHSSPG